MPLILGANSASGGYNVANSLRFNSGSSDYLNRTPASAGNRQIWTLSGWYKLAVTNTTDRTIFGAGTDGDNQTLINFQDTSVILFSYELSNVRYIVDTDAVYRDQSAWYHVVVAVDTTQATDTNRVKIYVNGVQQTLAVVLNGYPPQNADTFVNNTSAHSIGYASWVSINFYNGYMSEVYLIDGQQLTPSSFGQTDPSVPSSGIWIPKAYTGSFGTNGFYQKYANSAALGTDSSGNGNNFTVNNLTSIDQTTDTPTNNFATINILTCNDTGTLTAADGNLTITGGNDMGATINISKGKWYWESKRSNTGTAVHWGIGFTQSWNSSTQIVTGNGSGIFIRNDFVGGYNVNNSGSNGFTSISGSTTGSSIANGDIVGIALDLDSATKSITFYQNGSSVGSGTFSYDGTTTFCTPFIRNNSGGQTQWNFGNPPFTISSGNADANGYGNFEYAPPSGYYALCTKNLAEFG
jgi:hypothetical protein